LNEIITSKEKINDLSDEELLELENTKNKLEELREKKD